jgi:hypothetical protein
MEEVLKEEHVTISRLNERARELLEAHATVDVHLSTCSKI